MNISTRFISIGGNCKVNFDRLTGHRHRIRVKAILIYELSARNSHHCGIFLLSSGGREGEVGVEVSDGTIIESLDVQSEAIAIHLNGSSIVV